MFFFEIGISGFLMQSRQFRRSGGSDALRVRAARSL
jgi:hypothetical protein